MARSKKGAAVRSNEETVSLVQSNSSSGSPTNSTTSSRWLRLLGIILLGCFALFLWDSLEFDSAKGDADTKTKPSPTDASSSDKENPSLPFATDTPNHDANTKKSGHEDQIKKTPQPTEEPTRAPETPKPTDEPTRAPETPNPTTEAPTSKPTDALVETTSKTKKNNTAFDTAKCQETCAASTSTSTDDLTNSKTMMARFQQYRQQLVDRLQLDYGEEHYHAIFEPIVNDTTGERQNLGAHHAFVDPNRLPRGDNDYEEAKVAEGPAWSRMVRKWTIKLLQVQLGMLLTRQRKDDDNNGNVNPFCMNQCNGTAIGRKRGGGSPDLYAKYVWANGGHSASAGHGNFYRESYTANLGRDLQPILKEIGLDFEVRNYAMGGTESGEEVALCFTSIFGKDIDSITWDYGMMDGPWYHRLIMYTYGAARLALLDEDLSQPGNVHHRPSLMVVYHGDDMHPVLQAFQNMGLTALGMDMRLHKKKTIPAFPDMWGKNDEEIAALPPFVRYFRCQERVEEGEPGCNDNHFNMSLCPERTGRNSWHPGWRYHALMGHMMSLTLIHVIADSLQTMVDMEPAQQETWEEKHERITAAIEKLDKEEADDYANIFASPVPDEFKGFFKEHLWRGDREDANREEMQDIFTVEYLVKNFSFCHTGILPAEIRYRGFLTQNFEEVGTVMDYEYEQGVFLSNVSAIEDPRYDPDGPEVKPAPYIDDAHPGREEQMLIVSADREYEFWCPVETMKDHKDYFFISSEQGWRKIILPNTAETEYYKEFNVENSKGWILACLGSCDWDNCATGDIKLSVVNGTMDGGAYGRMEMEVNGVKVTDLKCLNKCCALQHDDADVDAETRYRWTPNENGQYEFRSRISGATKYGYARFSSFILL